MLNVICWLWHQEQGRIRYTAKHVNLLASMVRRNLKMPHRICCVTNTPEGIDPSVKIIAPSGEFEDITPRWGPTKPNCFRRLVMFRPDAAKTFGRRFVSIDLDCVIGGPLDPLFSRKDDFVIFKGTAPERPYNGSLMMLKAGARPQVYERFDQAAADVSGDAFHGSDQAWIAHCLGPDEATWTEADGVWSFDRFLKQIRKARPTIVFFPGKRKPWEYDRIFPFIKNNYRISQREAA